MLNNGVTVVVKGKGRESSLPFGHKNAHRILFFYFEIYVINGKKCNNSMII